MSRRSTKQRRAALRRKFEAWGPGLIEAIRYVLRRSRMSPEELLRQRLYNTQRYREFLREVEARVRQRARYTP